MRLRSGVHRTNCGRATQTLLIQQLPFMRMVKTISTAFSGTDEDGEPLLNWELDALNGSDGGVNALFAQTL